MSINFPPSGGRIEGGASGEGPLESKPISPPDTGAIAREQGSGLDQSMRPETKPLAQRLALRQLETDGPGAAVLALTTQVALDAIYNGIIPHQAGD